MCEYDAKEVNLNDVKEVNSNDIKNDVNSNDVNLYTKKTTSDISSNIQLKVGEINITISDHEIILEWSNSYLNDVVAMAITKSIKDIGHNIKTVRLSKMDPFETLFDTLKGYYSDVIIESDSIIINACNSKVKIKNTYFENKDCSISGNNPELVERVTSICNKISTIFKNCRTFKKSCC